MLIQNCGEAQGALEMGAIEWCEGSGVTKEMGEGSGRKDESV
jgi:hypothetical protein